MLIISEKEKAEMCAELGRHLPKLRELLRLSQKEFALRCGISTPRLSLIENGHYVMSRTQLTSVLFICAVNKRTKEYFFANRILNARLIQFLQMKDENIPPDINVCVDEAIVTAYSKEYAKKLVNENVQRKVMDDSERMRILNQTSREILFEYAPETDMFRYSSKKLNGDNAEGEYCDYMKNKVYKNTVHPDFWNTYTELILSAAASPVERTLEYRTRIEMNNYRWHSLTCHSTADENGVIHSVFGKIVDIDQLVVEREMALQKTKTDGMTGFLNKNTLKEQINERLAAARTPCALMMVDIDNFKTVNDRYGHIMGNKALTHFAEQLRKAFRSEDIIGRFGGDEFIVFMTNADTAVVKKRTETLIRLIHDSSFADSVKLTCSVGVICTHGGNQTADSLIGAADKLMYQAKQNGKNQVCFQNDV